MRSLLIARGNVHAVTYALGGRLLVSLNSGNYLRFWNFATFELSLGLPLPEHYKRHNASLAIQGNRLILNSDIFDITPVLGALSQSLETGRKPLLHKKEGLFARVDLEVDPRRLSCLAVTPDGKAIGGARYEVRPGTWPRWFYEILLWDDQGRWQRSMPTGDFLIDALAISPDGRFLAAAGGRKLLFLNLSDGEEVFRLDHTDSTQRVCFSPDGLLLASAAGRSVWLWDVTARQPITRFKAFQQYAEALAFHPAGRVLAAGSREGEVRFWDTASQKEIACFNWDVGAVHGLAFAPDGMTVAAAGHDNALVVWDLDL
jgi:hypothetical protein